jgi:hypothetical protein
MHLWHKDVLVTCSLPCKTPSKVSNESYGEVATETDLQITELDNFYKYNFVSLPTLRIFYIMYT